MPTKNLTKLYVVRCYDDSKLPVKKKTNTDSGFDVFAHNIKRYYKNFGTNSSVLIEDDAAIKNYFETIFTPEGAWVESIVLNTNERVLIGTGIKATVAEGYEIQVRSRSGVALKQGLIVTNGIGTIDFEFTGEIGVIITNTSNEPQRITIGDAIAQIVPMEVVLPELEEVTEFATTTRGTDGYGSTGSR